MLRNRRNLSAVPARARRSKSTGGEVANALVCKTSIRRFNSGPVLQNHLPSKAPLFPAGLRPSFPGIVLPIANYSLAAIHKPMTASPGDHDSPVGRTIILMEGWQANAGEQKEMPQVTFRIGG